MSWVQASPRVDTYPYGLFLAQQQKKSESAGAWASNIRWKSTSCGNADIYLLYIYARWKKWRHEPAFSAPLLSTRLDHLELENKLYCVRYGIYLLKWGAKSRASVSQGEKGRHLCDYVFCPEEDRWGLNLVRVKLESNSNTGKRAWKVKEITFKKKQRVREYNIIYLSRFKRGVPR